MKNRFIAYNINERARIPNPACTNTNPDYIPALAARYLTLQPGRNFFILASHKEGYASNPKLDCRTLTDNILYIPIQKNEYLDQLCAADTIFVRRFRDFQLSPHPFTSGIFAIGHISAITREDVEVVSGVHKPYHALTIADVHQLPWIHHADYFFDIFYFEHRGKGRHAHPTTQLCAALFLKFQQLIGNDIHAARQLLHAGYESSQYGLIRNSRLQQPPRAPPLQELVADLLQ